MIPENTTKETPRFNFNSFLKNLFSWVDSFQIDGKPGRFSVTIDKEEPSLYGTCDMVYNLKITNNLQDYLKTHREESLEEWRKFIQSYQNEKSGWFKEGLFNYGFHFKEHSTAFAVSALKLLGTTPKYPLKIAEKLNTQKKVEKWLKRGPEWGLLYWPGSHRGGGVAAVFATLGPEKYPHEDFFDWYFNWLDKNADPEVGFWRLGWIHKLKKDRLTKNELGGAVHYYWIYEFLNRPIPYPEKIIDSTLALQNDMGTWDTIDSYCIDLDAIFCLTRCLRQTSTYRIEEIKSSILKYLEHVTNTINNKEFFYSHYNSTHRLTGFLCAIAEIYKIMPNFLDLPKPWIQTLDITPWI
ncbi:MAG: hypothetical protein GF383_02245 [Candidatus Lokiarchaeota archaeon]|nr:hypothetical protein [Candidatus Lokiarchaeota archaeon]MBD3338235.1 hypothetical protein [Candidatus Lokiarchaeota archaeon]